MTELLLVGIGTGNPDHLTRQGEVAIRSADLVLVPRKGADKALLAEVRHSILNRVLDGATTVVAEFDLPKRAAGGDYKATVRDWHDHIADVWARMLAAHGSPATVALLIWGDPSLYDSSLRIAARLNPQPTIRVIPGITALQALTAAHGIALNGIGAPVTITTGRRLRDHGWPDGATTLAVMLDGECAFQTLDLHTLHIWWGAYLGMAEEILQSGPLAEVSDRIVARRAEARARHGWIMDCYLLRKQR